MKSTKGDETSLIPQETIESKILLIRSKYVGIAKCDTIKKELGRIFAICFHGTWNVNGCQRN